MRFGTLEDVRYGSVDVVGSGVRRVVAKNPSPFTYRGTGTYIVGTGSVAVIDPGPDLRSHRDALAAALVGEEVVAICVTHCHIDHSPLAAWLSAESGAPTVAFGPHAQFGDDDEAGEEIAEGVKVEESIDVAFVPDLTVTDGQEAATGGTGSQRWTLRAVHTPGHTSNHHCYAFEEERTLFSGDHVMGWSTTTISPPDGDMASYIESLHKVVGRRDVTLWPTHGPAITRPQRYVRELIAHRLDREQQVLEMLADGPTTIPSIVARLYAGVDERLHKAAGRSILAHLRKLVAEGLVVTFGGGPALTASTYARV